MTFGAIVFVILLVAAFVGIIYKEIYDSTNHIRCVYPNLLKEDATIVSRTSSVVGLKGSRCYRTIVRFSDGFEFITHETSREDHLFTYNIALTGKDLDNISIAAYAAHEKYLNKIRQKQARSK